MHLIFGGYAQGRLSYALKTYHKNETDMFDCAAQPLSEWNGQTILYHLEALVSQALQQNKAPLTLLQETVPNWQDCSRRKCSVPHSIGSAHRKRNLPATSRYGCMWRETRSSLTVVTTPASRCGSMMSWWISTRMSRWYARDVRSSTESCLAHARTCCDRSPTEKTQAMPSQPA